MGYYKNLTIQGKMWDRYLWEFSVSLLSMQLNIYSTAESKLSNASVIWTIVSSCLKLLGIIPESNITVT